MRLIAVLCLWLAAGVGTAQAAHIHGDWLPNKDTHASLPAVAGDSQGEEHCPLCVAMHTALPASLHAVPEPVAEFSQRADAQALVAAQRLKSFALFSRPPPVVVMTLAAGEASEDAALDASAAG